jgi:hypothetical protein
MKARLDAGTDVAMIGAWDAQRGAQPFTTEEFERLSDSLEAEADAGHAFFLRTKADGGGPVDVYIDEPIPAELLERLTPLGDAFVLALPSGSLMVDGAEYYRPKKPDAAMSARAVTVPAGDYALRCYAAKDEEPAQTPRPERELEAILGKEDLRYYERVTRGGCVTGLLLLLLLPALWPLFGLKVAFAVTAVTFVGYFIVREQVLRRNARFARLRETITAFRLGHDEPVFVLELRRVPNRAELTGGSVSVE